MGAFNRSSGRRCPSWWKCSQVRARSICVTGEVKPTFGVCLPIIHSIAADALALVSMNPSGGGPSGGFGGPSGGSSQGSPSAPLSPEALSLLWEGISLVFSRWTALLLAVEDQTGGRDSRWKSEEFASAVLSWFSQTKELYIDDLENLLYENMDQLFHMDVCDDSVEQVAYQLMVIHEDCLKGSSESVEKLRKQGNARNAVHQSKRVVADDEDDESSDEETTDMVVDEPITKGLSVNHQPKLKETADEDGWSVVTRKGRGKRNG